MRSLFLILLWAASTAGAPLDCSAALRSLIGPYRYDASHLHTEWRSTRARLIASGETAPEVDALFEGLIAQFAHNSHRIHSPLAQGYYLKGAILSARSGRELALATSNLSLPEEHLNHFAARMAYFAHKHAASLHAFPNSDHLKGSHMELERFDQGNAAKLGLHYNAQTGTLSKEATDPGELAKMRRQSLPVPLTPVGGLQFNNGRKYTFSEHPIEELWAAIHFSREQPEEALLSLGDPSTRSFYPLFRLHNGKLVREPPAADFLSLRPRDSGQFEFVVRELKYYAPQNPIDVSHALKQLRTTVDALGETQPNTPVGAAELVTRTRTKAPGSGYRFGPEVKQGLFPLHRADGSAVSLPSLHGPVPVFVRFVPDLP